MPFRCNILAAAIAFLPCTSEADDAGGDAIIITAQVKIRYDASSDSTGSKTGTAVRDIPASIQSVPAAALADQAVREMNEAVRNVSGLQPIYGGGYGSADNYVIRGLRSRFLRDGLPDGPTFVGYARSFSDVQSIDVLKGPGSAIYGRTEPGGVINIVTKKPTMEFGGSISATAGSLKTRGLQGDINLPVSTALALRVTGDYSDNDGIRGLSKRIATGAATLLWQISPAHQLTAKYEHYDQRYIVDNYGIIADFDGEILPVDRNTRYYTPDNRVDQKIDRITFIYEGDASDALHLRAAYRKDQRDLAYKRNSGITLSSARLLTGRIQRQHADAMNFQVAQVEATLKSDFGKTLVGSEIEANRFEVRRIEFAFPRVLDPFNPQPEANANGINGRLIYDRKIKSDTVSAYIQQETSIGEMLKLRGGYRIDWVDFGDRGVSTARPVAGQAGPFTLSFSQKLPTGQVGVVFQPTKTVSIYGGYTAGKFINVQSEATILTELPETSSQLETGIKWDAIPGKLNVNLAAYKVKRRDFYVTLVPGANPLPVGAQDAKGLELDITGEILPGVNIIANYAFLDAANVSREIGTTFGGTTFVRTGSVYGKEPIASARHGGSIWMTADMPIDGFSIGGGLVGKSQSYADALNVIRTPGYVIGNAAMFYRSTMLDIALNIKNVTDKDYFINPTFAGALPGDPRTILLTVTGKF